MCKLSQETPSQPKGKKEREKKEKKKSGVQARKKGNQQGLLTV